MFLAVTLGPESSKKKLAVDLGHIAVIVAMLQLAWTTLFAMYLTRSYASNKLKYYLLGLLYLATTQSLQP